MMICKREEMKWKIEHCIQYFPAKAEQTKKITTKCMETRTTASMLHASSKNTYTYCYDIYTQTTTRQHHNNILTERQELTKPYITWIAYKLIFYSQRNQSTWFASSTYLICHTQDRTELQIQWSMQTFKQTTNCNLHFASM